MIMNQQTALQWDSTGDTIEKDRWDESATYFSHLDALEAEALLILREVAAECRNPALLFSGGKDSAVALHLAYKAFHPEKIGFVLLHVDTGHNYPEVIGYRDRMATRYGCVLRVAEVEDSIRRGTVRLRHPLESRNPHQSVTLLEAIAEHGFDACVGGARRD
jgi:sulfate adenylyltransferase subunit 2